MKHDVAKFEKKLRGLGNSWKELSDDNGYNELFKIIHFPGYTTPAEFRLVNDLTDSMISFTQILLNMKRALIAGSHEIIEEKVNA